MNDYFLSAVQHGHDACKTKNLVSHLLGHEDDAPRTWQWRFDKRGLVIRHTSKPNYPTYIETSTVYPKVGDTIELTSALTFWEAKGAKRKKQFIHQDDVIGQRIWMLKRLPIWGLDASSLEIEAPQTVSFIRTKETGRQQWRRKVFPVRVTATVTNQEALAHIINHGVGSYKAYGIGFIDIKVLTV